MVPVNAPIAVIGAAGEVVSDQLSVSSKKVADEKPAPQTQPTVVLVTQTVSSPSIGPVKASPLAKKIAKDNQLDLSRIQGTGPGGRVVRKDVESALATGTQSAVRSTP